MADPDAWADLADDIRRGRASDIERAEAWQARAEKAEARVAELEAEAKVLADDRGKLMRVLTVQTGETMRFHDACDAALAMLREDRAQAALALLEETIDA